MLIVVSPTEVINLDNVDRIRVEYYNRDAAYLKFDSSPVKFHSRAEAEHVLTGIVDAYARGDKVFYINKE